MSRNYLSERIYTLIDKGYSKEVILKHVVTKVARHVNIETIDRVYEITKKKWLRRNK